MPIFEFKCLGCEEFIEILVMNKEETVEMTCPKCKGKELERVLSSTNYAMNSSTSKSSGASTQERQCSGGSCTTYTLPGHTQ